MDEAQAFGSRLRSLMAERGLTLVALAMSIGITQHELNRYLNGELLPNEALLIRMSTALNVPPSHLRGNV